MKISYSKVILGGIIASTFLMAGCQKKGSVRGVTTPGISTNKTDNQADNEAQVEKPNQAENENTESGSENKTSVPAAESEKVPKKDDVKVNVEADEFDITPTAESQVETPQESGTQPVAKPVASETEAAKKEEAKKEEPKKEEKLSVGQACPEKTIATTIKSMEAQAKIIKNLNEIKTSTADQKVEKFNEYLKTCELYKAQFKSEKVESCLIDKKPIYSMTSLDKTCRSAALQVDYYSFKKTRLEVSDRLNELFLKENQSWKMYLVDGESFTDSRKVQDFVNDKKVVCTFLTNSEKNIDITKNSFTIDNFRSRIMTELSTEKIPGFDFRLQIGAVKKDDNSSTAQFFMSCVGLGDGMFDIKKIQKTLGDYLAAKKPVSTASTETTQAVKSTEPVK